jgi:hypothetical protein
LENNNQHTVIIPSGKFWENDARRTNYTNYNNSTESYVTGSLFKDDEWVLDSTYFRFMPEKTVDGTSYDDDPTIEEVTNGGAFVYLKPKFVI